MTVLSLIARAKNVFVMEFLISFKVLTFFFFFFLTTECFITKKTLFY